MNAAPGTRGLESTFLREGFCLNAWKLSELLPNGSYPFVFPDTGTQLIILFPSKFNTWRTTRVLVI
jgi:hypothetical protein